MSTVTKRNIRLSAGDKERVIAFNCAMQYFKKWNVSKHNDNYYNTMHDMLYEAAPVIIINKLKGYDWMMDWARDSDMSWDDEYEMFISIYSYAYKQREINRKIEREAEQAQREAEAAAAEYNLTIQ